MVERSAAAAADAMNGTVVAGDPGTRWSGAAFDSRLIDGGEIFFALTGERADGHDFVAQAVAGGAAAVVVHRDLEHAEQSRRDQTHAPIRRDDAPRARLRRDAAWLRVDDTYRALHDLTRAVRLQVPERLVAITGSVGKTTTKELLAAMMTRRFRTERSHGNLNNLYGFPLSLLNIRDDCQWMVAEMGMSTPGELRQISLLGRPDVAVFTNVRPAHLENFRHLRDIADAKAELLAGLADSGLVVANAGDPEVMYIVDRHREECRRAGVRYVLYGMEGAPSPRMGANGKRRSATGEIEVTATAPRALSDGRTGSRFVLAAGGESVDVELPIHGLYNVENCLAAAACAHALGVSLTEIAAAVVDFEPGHMRGEVHRRGRLTIIDDCYNSNPDAASRALESACRLPARRYVAMLGDMLELGPESPSFHRAIGDRAAELGFGLVVGVGELARELTAAAGRGGTESHWLVDAGEAARWASSALESGELGAGDLILVKGSRGVGLEVAVEALLAEGREN